VSAADSGGCRWGLAGASSGVVWIIGGERRFVRGVGEVGGREKGEGGSSNSKTSSGFTSVVWLILDFRSAFSCCSAAFSTCSWLLTACSLLFSSIIRCFSSARSEISLSISSVWAFFLSLAV